LANIKTGKLCSYPEQWIHSMPLAAQLQVEGKCSTEKRMSASPAWSHRVKRFSGCNPRTM